MSIIIHGPQGCGKSRHAEQLRRHFGMRLALEGDEAFNGRLYKLLAAPKSAARIKAMYAVILTHERPPEGLTSLRIVSFADAMKQIND